MQMNLSRGSEPMNAIQETEKLLATLTRAEKAQLLQ
jgi:hypothetical protein